MKTKVAIVGVTGFAGEKLIEILARHPNVELVNLSCRLDKPKSLASHYPRFAGILDLDMEPIDLDKIAKIADVVFLSLPHTVSFNYVPKLLAAGKIVIDLSADYRLKDHLVYNKHYGVAHSDIANISVAVYGLPELYRDKIKKAKLIANPGCYPTVAALSLAPLVKQGLVDNIIIDAKSGITGAGRKADLSLNYTAINSNLYAYKIFKHQHQPEIAQTLSDLAGKPMELVFTPHVVPLEQGILATVYADMLAPLTRQEIVKMYQDFYNNEFFVRVMAEGLPKLKDVVNTNFCDIGLEVQGKKIIIIATIDNLMRGASSQAVQNMNIILGLDERTGLL
jgi:N-acetyl-gamma-glutamyl-phosphate reductase